MNFCRVEYFHITMRMQEFLKSLIIFYQIYENLPINVEVVDDFLWLWILFEDGIVMRVCAGPVTRTNYDIKCFIKL